MTFRKERISTEKLTSNCDDDYVKNIINTSWLSADKNNDHLNSSEWCKNCSTHYENVCNSNWEYIDKNITSIPIKDDKGNRLVKNIYTYCDNKKKTENIPNTIIEVNKTITNIDKILKGIDNCKYYKKKHHSICHKNSQDPTVSGLGDIGHRDFINNLEKYYNTCKITLDSLENKLIELKEIEKTKELEEKELREQKLKKLAKQIDKTKNIKPPKLTSKRSKKRSGKRYSRKKKNKKSKKKSSNRK
jgi:hypothetical protein